MCTRWGRSRNSPVAGTRRLPRLTSDLVPLMQAAALGDLPERPHLEWDPSAAVGIVVASGGYPTAIYWSCP